MRPDSRRIGQAMIALWGREGLRRCSPRALRDVAIPEASRQFLIEFGLPAFWGWPFLAGVGDELPRLGAQRPHLRVLSVEPSAFGSHNFICLDETRAGRIIRLLGLASGQQEEMVNTNVEAFAAHMALHRELLSETAALEEALPSYYSAEGSISAEGEAFDRAFRELLDRTEQEMRRADPPLWQGMSGTAFDYVDNEEGTWEGYWACVLGEFGEYCRSEEVLPSWLGEQRDESG